MRRNIPVGYAYALLKEKATFMRKNPTDAERIMWDFLRRKYFGIKFRRQHIIGEYIVDFVSLQNGLIIEVDGGYHNLPEQIQLDNERSEFLEKNGFKVLCVSNEEVIGALDNIDAKILKIIENLL